MTVPLSKTIHELTLIEIRHKLELAPWMILDSLMSKVYFDIDENQYEGLFDFWFVNLRFNK